MKWIKGRDGLPSLFKKVKWRNADGGNIPLGEATPLEHYQRTGANIEWHEWLDESPSPLSGEEIKPFDSAGARVHFLLNLKKAQLMEYIYDFAWHYGRLYHIGDAEKIKEAIKEKFQLPEEFLYELLNRDQEAQASVARDSDSSTSDGKQNNSSHSGEQQPVTGEWQRCPICEGTGQILADGFTSLVYQTCPTCEGQRIIQKPIIEPPTPEPAGELYRWVKASGVLPDRADVWLANNKPQYGRYVHCKVNGKLGVGYFGRMDNRLHFWYVVYATSTVLSYPTPVIDHVDYDNFHEIEWLEKVEPQQNQDE